MNEAAPASQMSTRLDTLDMLRWLAALAVLAGHARAYVFVSYPELHALGIEGTLGTKLFYFVTGLGHEAVIVFFALSGYLVGGKVIHDLRHDQFSWLFYILRRMTRLWLVLIPALLATAVFDWIGITLTSGVGYDGTLRAIYTSLPGPDSPVDNSASVFLGNIAFLQTITVPPYGTNGPLWSLAYEFWYYLLFPLAAWPVLSDAPLGRRLIAIAVLLLLLALLPAKILLLGTIWAAGAAASRMVRQFGHHRILTSPITRVVAIALLLAAIAATRTTRFDPGDVVLGLLVAAILPVLALLPSPSRWYSRLARGGSEISYTLYVSHFPLITLVILAWQAPVRMAPGWPATGLFFALIGLALLWSLLLWALFERHTNRLFRAIATRLWNARR